MRAIHLMFDTLRRDNFSIYDETCHAITPNFARLAEKTVTFDRFYGGSMPCMPARRELHTGRYNFLHRGWGPLEPFDESIIETLKNNGVYTHLITDHAHYFCDGGGTYHNRYNSYEFNRGQEGDRWKSIHHGIDLPAMSPNNSHSDSVKFNYASRETMLSEEDFSISKNYDQGIDFLKKNVDTDHWFLQIESFDPHEPYFTTNKYLDMYDFDYDELNYDYPSVHSIDDPSDKIQQAKANYLALVSMCDANLGKVLDFMDDNDMWKDTMLIVNTDHGQLHGEHRWWGKNVMPFYEEIIHIPFFIWSPESKKKNVHCDVLAQTIDIPATLKDHFKMPGMEMMQGKSLLPAIEDNVKIRDFALFGIFGAQVGITDGEYVYLRSNATDKNQPLFEYTLMFTDQRSFKPLKQLSTMELYDGFRFTKGIPVVKIKTNSWLDTYRMGHSLYDLRIDPKQTNPIKNAEKEIEMINALITMLKSSEAPSEQYVRLGLLGQYTPERIQSEEHERVNAYKLPFQTEIELGLRCMITNALMFYDDPSSVLEKLKETDLSYASIKACLIEQCPQPKRNRLMQVLSILSRVD